MIAAGVWENWRLQCEECGMSSSRGEGQVQDSGP